MGCAIPAGKAVKFKRKPGFPTNREIRLKNWISVFGMCYGRKIVKGDRRAAEKGDGFWGG